MVGESTDGRGEGRLGEVGRVQLVGESTVGMVERDSLGECTGRREKLVGERTVRRGEYSW